MDESLSQQHSRLLSALARAINKLSPAELECVLAGDFRIVTSVTDGECLKPRRKRETLPEEWAQQVKDDLEALDDPAFRADAGELPGYDTASCGHVTTLEAA